jgi:flagellar export protein FliJ
MTYRFRLERLLQYYRTREEEARDELERRRGIQAAEKEKLALLQAEQQSLSEHLAGQVESGADLRFLGLGYDYFYWTLERLEQQSKREKEAGLQVNRQRKRLTECWRDKRSLELLKEKRLMEYYADQSRQERKVQDELTLARFSRTAKQR